MRPVSRRSRLARRRWAHGQVSAALGGEGRALARRAEPPRAAAEVAPVQAGGVAGDFVVRGEVPDQGGGAGDARGEADVGAFGGNVDGQGHLVRGVVDDAGVVARLAVVATASMRTLLTMVSECSTRRPPLPVTVPITAEMGEPLDNRKKKGRRWGR